MARPKKAKVNPLPEAEQPSKEEPLFTETALGIYKQEDGSYYLAEVAYDPITGEATLEDLHRLGTSSAEASERFKIEAVKKGFV